MPRTSQVAILVVAALSLWATGSLVEGCTQAESEVCDIKAYCSTENGCECMPGTIDVSTGDPGTACKISGYSIRYVSVLKTTDSALNSTILSDPANWCVGDVKGFYSRGTPDIFAVQVDWLNHFSALQVEINCLYGSKPDEAEVASYYRGEGGPGTFVAGALDILDAEFFLVEPQVYSWTLPTTSAPIRVPPTGFVIDSVSFDKTCESTGCWVITGVVTDGNAFDSYGAFNTFFLPQAEAPDNLSYDFDYSAVDWTFQPSEHPCTSVNYEADGAEGIARVEACCITNDGEGDFVDNYRPSRTFVEWAQDNLEDKCSGGDLGGGGGAGDLGGGGGDSGDRCWNVYKESYNQVGAEAFCQEKGGKLVSIHNTIDEYVWHAMVNNFAVDPWDTFWSGLEVAAGTFSWTDGSVYDFSLPLIKYPEHPSIDTIIPRVDQEATEWIGCFYGRTMESGTPGIYDLHLDLAEYGTNGCTSSNPASHRFVICAETRAEEGEGACCDSDDYSNSAPVDCGGAGGGGGAGVISTGIISSPGTNDNANLWDTAFPFNFHSMLRGPFKGMSETSGVVKLDMKDPFLGQYNFEVRVDEVEMRTMAGKLTGTVGVEYTVDTFLGLANFRPTGSPVLDTFASQTALHLEKTNFFSVSTHGQNDYTFLEYVNMRLVTVYEEDDDFSGEPVEDGFGDSESADRTVRTDSSGNVNYVQVTFTLGSAYTVNDNPSDDVYTSGLIPLDSVRAGRGTFRSEAEDDMQHVCSTYWSATDENLIGLSGAMVSKNKFDEMVMQDCAPKANMCVSPSAIPDNFVSFNIPLGMEIFDDQESSILANSIFVHMVVNALKASGGPTPNEGDDAMQMKTTLSASIPIVAGGINIFCDGVTAKTDLKDVASVDIIVGTAASDDELSRVRILGDVASTDLSEVPRTEINSDSIQSGLMTLVIKGDHDYFQTVNTNTGDYTIELDDVITIHLMEGGTATDATEGDGSKEGTVLELLAELGDDNSDSSGLDTDGYALNGAFGIIIDRASGVGHLEPSEALKQVCPFNPTRVEGNIDLETCILRRDVQNRDYPNRPGAPDTAMEVLAASSPKDSTSSSVLTAADSLDSTSSESDFMVTVLGSSDYAKELAVDFAKVIRAKYELNGRYRRAYWINPGYEWTPTQTAGLSIFSVSQKLYMFALVSLDENWERRRMLLQATSSGLEDTSSGMSAASVTFETSPQNMLASAFKVPVDRVATFSVTASLTPAEACMSASQLQASLRLTFEDYLSDAASAIRTVQIARLEVDRGSEECGSGRRRNIRKLLQGFSTATAVVDMVVVFQEGGDSIINLQHFGQKPGVIEVTASEANSPRVVIDNTYMCTENCGDSKDKVKGGSVNVTAIIAGVVGGVAGLVLIALGVFGVFRYMKNRQERCEHPVELAMFSAHDLKAQLSAEM